LLEIKSGRSSGKNSSFFTAGGNSLTPTLKLPEPEFSRSRRSHRRFPERLAFTLNNRIRSLINPPEQLISKLNIRPKDVVVDFGCGPGFFTVPLAKVAGKTIAIDVSSQMLKRAAYYAKKSGVMVEFIKSDGTEIKLQDESVDLILLNHVFHEVEDKPKVLGEFLRTMKPAGRLVVVEKTRGGGVFSGKLGPPIIDVMEVTREMERAGFAYVETIPYGKDSIIISQKTASALRHPS